MSIFNVFRGQFIDIIEWNEPSQNDILAYRFPRFNNEIKMGAKLIVREGQAALFVNEGQLSDIFLTAGTYTLTTQNLPILATLKGWKYGFNSPFKAEVYFISLRQWTDQKWGTNVVVDGISYQWGMPIVAGLYDAAGLRSGNKPVLVGQSLPDAQIGFFLCSSIRWRSVPVSGVPAGLSSGGTSAGAGGGGVPSRFSNTHLPRFTGEVLVGFDVTVKIDAWVRIPPRWSPVKATRRKFSPATPGIP